MVEDNIQMEDIYAYTILFSTPSWFCSAHTKYVSKTSSEALFSNCYQPLVWRCLEESPQLQYKSLIKKQRVNYHNSLAELGTEEIGTISQRFISKINKTGWQHLLFIEVLKILLFQI